VLFRSAAPYAVCSHCQSLLVRTDVSLEAIGRIAQVPEDFSPLQLLASGTFDKQRFTLIGRIRKTWSEGGWNEWCALFDDQRIGWLAEAQGDLVMTFASDAHTAAPQPSLDWVRAVAAGQSVRIGGQAFIVSDVKEVSCIGAEGELARNVSQGRRMTSIDLHGPGVAFATIEESAGQVELFVGRFVEFDECRFAGLRALSGWQPPSPASTR
jgi:hypothetical protein